MRMLEPGEEFAGYRIVRILGRGGMGAVYAAAHPRLPRTVALKLLTLSGTDASAQARFEREAELLVQLDHPGIVNIFDRGVDGEVPWIAMQFVDGEDASTALRRQGVFAPDRVQHLAAQVAEALDFAHSRGVLHRDVKPGNILLAPGERGERAVLVDFGIAATANAADPHLTQTGYSVATIDYAAPEQLRGGRIDGRADQYALAATCYTLLTGRPPFVGSAAEVAAAQLHSPPTRVDALRPGVAAAAADVIQRGLAKDPGGRFPSCTAFSNALGEALAGATVAVSAPVAEAQQAPSAPARSSRKPVWIAGAVALALAAGGAGAYALAGHGSSAGGVQAASPTTTSDASTPTTSTTSAAGAPAAGTSVQGSASSGDAGVIGTVKGRDLASTAKQRLADQFTEQGLTLSKISCPDLRGPVGTRISCPATVSGVSAKVSVVITSLVGSTVNLNFTLGDGVLVVQKLATFTETKFGVQDLSCGGKAALPAVVGQVHTCTGTAAGKPVDVIVTVESTSGQVNIKVRSAASAS